jgi:hypothetical protein
MQDFIPFKEAVALKELGFNEHCFATYIGETFDSSVQFLSDDYFTAAPTFSQAFRFFREKYDLQYWLRNGGYLGKCFIQITGYKHDKIYFSSSEPMEYEEAELACLRRLIEIVN